MCAYRGLGEVAELLQDPLKDGNTPDTPHEGTVESLILLDLRTPLGQAERPAAKGRDQGNLSIMKLRMTMRRR